MKYRNSHPEVFCEKSVLRNFSKFTGIARFLRTSFLIEHFRWPLLKILDSVTILQTVSVFYLSTNDFHF